MALLIPCTKYKPYSTSREHRAINGALLAAGWSPVGESSAPSELLAVLDPGEDPALLHEGPLGKDGVLLDRIVMSEPLALVPYPFIYEWEGTQSVATSYDDPGLFEGRGTSVSPERPDSTAVELSGGKWRWGPAEREAYVEVHNHLSGVIARVLSRVGPRYRAVGAWVSPGLTHRSFLADAALRHAEGLPRWRRGTGGRLPLHGVLDELPGAVTVMPTVDAAGAGPGGSRRAAGRRGTTRRPGSGGGGVRPRRRPRHPAGAARVAGVPHRLARLDCAERVHEPRKPPSTAGTAVSNVPGS